MKFKFLKTIFTSIVLLASSLVNVANAGLITFEETSHTSGWDSTYLGWTLHNSQIYTNLWAPSTVSGDNALVNYNSRIGEFTRDNIFNFEGAFFTRDGRYSGTTALVNVFGLDQLGNTIYSTQLTLTNAPAYFSFGWDNIYGISWDPIGNEDSSNIGIDNFSFSEVSQNVPEPSTLAIFALGMIGLASRRFKKQS
jgi:hypothetical protein